MIPTLYFVVILGCLAVACLVLLFLWRGQVRRGVMLQASSEEREREAAAQVAALQSRLESAERAATQDRAAAEEVRLRNEEQIRTLIAQRTQAEVMVRTLTERGERDRAELEKLQASFRAEFRNLANDILEEKSVQFKQTNKEALDALLKPFRDNITDFRERVEKIYSAENEQRGALKNEIRNLLDLNRRITEETTNLTNALRGNSKVQGDWGEMILETILDSSNLVNGIHYTLQENFKDGKGNNLRPDVVLRLPDKKQIVIDSKVSLTAFVNYANAEEPEQRDRFLKEHLLSVRRHVDELGAKRYQELVNSPDFVIMFIPNEPAFLAALQHDTTIWNDAYRKKVIVSSPTNLFALLKIVDDLWKRDNQNRNALQIAKEGANLYDKFVGFVETLEALGKNLGAASTSYSKAMNQLVSGSGNLVGRTEKLRKLGLKASKNMPERLTEAAELALGEESEDIDEMQEREGGDSMPKSKGTL